MNGEANQFAKARPVVVAGDRAVGRDDIPVSRERAQFQVLVAERLPGFIFVRVTLSND